MGLLSHVKQGAVQFGGSAWTFNHQGDVMRGDLEVCTHPGLAFGGVERASTVHRGGGGHRTNGVIEDPEPELPCQVPPAGTIRPPAVASGRSA